MAAKNFRSTLLEPTSEFAKGDRLRFTALSTSGSVFNNSFSETVIGDNGQYSVDLQYGKYRIDYKPYECVWQKFADVEVSASTLATSLQALALSSKPVTDDTILTLQSLLADAEAANADAQTAKAAAEEARRAAEDARNEANSILLYKVSYYVDPDFLGASDGSVDNPFVSISDAIAACPEGRELEISCRSGEVNVIRGSVDARHINAISIYPFGVPYKTTVRFEHSIDGDGIMSCGIRHSDGFSFSAYYTDLVIDDYLDSTTEVDSYSVAAFSAIDRSSKMRLMLDSCRIECSGFPMIDSSVNRISTADINISMTEIVKSASVRSDSALFSSAGGSLFVSDLSLNGLTALDLVKDKSGWLSNVVWY